MVHLAISILQVQFNNREVKSKREEGEEDEAVGESVARGVWSHEGRVSCPAPTTTTTPEEGHRQGLATLEFLIM